MDEASVIKIAREFDLNKAAVKAVIAVESSGQPFVKAGSASPRGLEVGGLPIIQFEGHVFWSRLKAAGRNPQAIYNDQKTAAIVDATGKAIGKSLLADVLYPRLDMSKMRAPAREWDQLTAARAIAGPEIADQCASWGAFQIMGFNYKSCGRATVAEFVKASETTEGQTLLFFNFLKSQAAIAKALRSLDFKRFALLYNGKRALANGYDLKLRREYEKALK
jgi:hypothetical protein